MNDFTVYDAYINDGAVIPGLLAWEGEPPRTQLLPPRPQRVDTGQNPFEARPEYGDFFAQGDFSGGAEQLRAHTPESKPTRYFWSEGIDISQPGRIKLLFDTVSVGSSDIDFGRSLEIADGEPFWFKNDAGNQRVYRGGTTFPLTETAENPHIAEGNQNIQDLASSGDELYAAITTNGIHRRDNAGTWTHFVAQGSTVIDRIKWVRNSRLMAADGRNIYEIVTSGSLPTALETLPIGWRFEAIWEYGPFIYASAINVNTGHCRIHHYGLNQSASALEAKGSTELPIGQLVYSGHGYLGISYLGGGRRNNLGGLEPFVYQAVQDAQGFLSLIKLVEREASGTSELPVKAMEPYGESMFFGWCLGTSATVDQRNGIAVHHLDRDAFAHHLQGGIENVTAIKVYKGRVLFVCAGDRLYVENVGTYVAPSSDSNYLITSLADWHNAGQKVFDLFEVSHSALAAGESVEVKYATANPLKIGSGAYTQAINSTTVGSEGAQATLTGNVKGRQITLRIHIDPNAGLTTAPEVYTVSVRSAPAPVTNEYVLSRTFRILDKDRKDELAPPVYHDVDVVREALQELANTWVEFDEPGQTWTALITAVEDVQPLAAQFHESTGEEEAKGFVVRLQMIARKA